MKNNTIDIDDIVDVAESASIEEAIERIEIEEEISVNTTLETLELASNIYV